MPPVYWLCVRKGRGRLSLRELWSEEGRMRMDSPSPEHLGEDAADAPQVHRRGVAGLQQHLRGPVPQSDHLQDKTQLTPRLQLCAPPVSPLRDKRVHLVKPDRTTEPALSPTPLEPPLTTQSFQNWKGQKKAMTQTNKRTAAASSAAAPPGLQRLRLLRPPLQLHG